MRLPRRPGLGPGVPRAALRPPAWARAAIVAALLAIAPAPALAAGDRAASPDPAGARDAVPACRYADVVTADAGYDAWAGAIVDTELRLPDGYEPPDLVPVGRAGIAGRGKVRELLVADLASLAEAASTAGAPLSVISAYRSAAAQARVFAGWERSSGHDAALLASARRGHSEHELGTTLDFTTPDGSGPWANDFGHSPQAHWLHAHAWSYGFVESYPARDSPTLTCYQAEPWHYRYLGRALAEAVHASGEPLRAYLYRHRSGPDPATPDPEPATAGESPPARAARADPSAGTMAPAAAAPAGSLDHPELWIGILAGLVLGRLRAIVTLLVGRGRPSGRRSRAVPGSLRDPRPPGASIRDPRRHRAG